MRVWKYLAVLALAIAASFAIPSQSVLAASCNDLAYIPGMVRFDTGAGQCYFLKINADGSINTSGGLGAVTSVSNVDGTLTVTPTIGDVVASLNLSNPNTWTGTQGFTGGLTLRGSSSGVISVLPQAAAGTYNFNMPTTAGTAGQLLTSQGGAGAPMTWTNAGAGSVTSVATGAGLTGGTITTSGTISATALINAQTGTSYTILSTDAAKLVTFSNGASVAVTLPQATGSFTTGFAFGVQNKGAGTVTITPTTSTINGAASLAVPTDRGCWITSDGTNWQVDSCTALVTGGGSGCTVAGTAGQAVYNNGTTGCLSSAATFTSGGALTLPQAGAASTPGLVVSGAPYAAGTGTTNYPQIYANCSGSAQPTTLNTAATFYGANSCTGFAGDFINFFLNGGTSRFRVDSGGGINTVAGAVLGNGNGTVAIQWGSGAANRFVFNSSGTSFASSFFSTTAGGPQLRNAACTSTTAVFNPNQADSTTGISCQASGNMSAVVAGVEKGRWTAQGYSPVQATAPTCTGTGTPTITTGSTDSAGSCTAGTSATSVVITWNLTHAAAPVSCVVSSSPQLAALSYTKSNTALTITQTATTGNVIDYNCTFAP